MQGRNSIMMKCGFLHFVWYTFSIVYIKNLFEINCSNFGIISQITYCFHIKQLLDFTKEYIYCNKIALTMEFNVIRVVIYMTYMYEIYLA